MKNFKKIIGDRIYLSPMGISDEEVEKYTEWLNDFQVTDYIGRSALITTLESEKEYLEKSTKSQNSARFNIVDLETEKLIGTVSLERLEFVRRSGMLGIFIGDGEYRNKGYGTEAIRLILEYGFRYLNLHSITLDLVSVNERAHQCYLKCGFKDVGKSRESVFLNGKYYDILHMDILENEFEVDYIKNKNIK